MPNAFPKNNTAKFNNSRNFLKNFLILFTSSLTVIGGISLAFYFIAQQSRQGIIEHQEKFTIAQQEEIIQNDIKSIVSDLMLLTNHHRLHSNFTTHAANSFDTVAKEFLNFSRQKQIYDQVRFIDSKGMEKVRINYNHGRPTIVPMEMLQLKKERYYFKDTFKLQAGEVFISPFDLNIEKGVVEQPVKPTIRFGAPVFNSDGDKIGIIILNYIGMKILTDINKMTDHSFGQLALVNKDGYWLLGPDRDEEWGFMYADRKETSFAYKKNTTWDRINQNKSGLFYDNGDLYIFDTIFPLLEGLKSSTGSGKAYKESIKSLSANQYYWKIISHLSQKDLNRHLFPNMILYICASVLVVLLLAFACWLIASLRTKQLQAEQNVNESEQKFRTIADFSYDMDAWVYPDGRYAYISPSCERITGYPPKYFLDDPNFFLEIAHPDDRKLLGGHRSELLEKPENKAEIYFRIIRKTGDIRWIWHQCQSVYSEDGEWLGRRTTNRDITEKHRIETTLQRERDMFLHGPVVTFTWKNDTKWSADKVSSNIFNILGYEAEDFISKSVVYADCIHPDDLDRVTDEVTFYSKSGDDSFIHRPYRLISKSGATVWVLDTTSIIRDENGIITHYLGYLLDISEQKKQEQLLLESAKQEEEIKRIESLKTLAGAIAHRFNNAMTAVQGNLDIMTMTLPHDSDEYELAANASQAARGASQVGTMMLSYVGQNSPQPIKTSLLNLAQESVAALKDIFPSTITLDFAQPNHPFYCSIDPRQIKEVLESILTNACESFDDDTGSIEITFGTEHITTDTLSIPFQHDDLQDGMYTFCQIKDSGHGIKLKNLSRIFEPFYTTKFVGRGLGLSLTVGLMQAHRGAITIESSQEMGTTVKVLLPFLPDSSDENTQ